MNLKNDKKTPIIIYRYELELQSSLEPESRSGSRAPATSKMERFVIIVNGFQP